MKNHTRIIRYSICAAILIGLPAAMGTRKSTFAQDPEKSSKEKSTKKVSTGSSGRDPFSKYVPPPPPKRVVKPGPTPIAVPTIQERIERFKAQKMAAMNAQLPPPKATTALLLNEMQVIGIFRTPRGTAAMVEATPIKLSYVVYPGETFYDGQLVAIEENRLVFRHSTRFTDGRIVKDVEVKPLRTPDAITDSLAATKTSKSAEETSQAKSDTDKKTTPEKQ
jgi:hypothetical protein